jgi:hypothetical protein
MMHCPEMIMPSVRSASLVALDCCIATDHSLVYSILIIKFTKVTSQVSVFHILIVVYT